MKRALSALLLAFTVVLGGCEGSELYNSLNTSMCYVQIPDAIENKSEARTTYDYDLTGYDRDGNSKKVKLNENKRLRKDAYLRVELKNDNQVKGWEEVQPEDLPEKVKEKLEVK